MNGRVLPLMAEQAEIANETSSTLKAFGVLEVLVRAGRPVTLSELMQATELPKPTLHRTLALFEEAGFLSREPGGRAYIIGERLSRFGLDVLRNDGAATLRRIVLRRVVSEIGESCSLAAVHQQPRVQARAAPVRTRERHVLLEPDRPPGPGRQLRIVHDRRRALPA
jgi:DNA-binding IclR family transcriptional regulator